MAKVNLEQFDKQTFGERLPTVFIEKIELDSRGSIHGRQTLDIIPTVTMRFTKPQHLQFETLRDYIQERLSKLALYVSLSYNSWVHRDLERGSFSIYQWATRNPQYASAFRNSVSDDSYSYDGAQYIIPIKDLIHVNPEDEDTDDTDPVVTYDAVLTTSPSLDADGDEIFLIENIRVPMTYKSWDLDSLDVEDDKEYHPEPPDFMNVPNLVVLAWVGPDMGTQSAAKTIMKKLAREKGHPAEQTFNKYFGNISYYTVLQNGISPARFFQTYLKDGIPYRDPVIQSINGKVYPTDDYSFDDITTTLRALVSEFELERSTDSVLNKNLQNLEAIFNAQYNKSGMLRELAGYRGVFPNKRPGSLSRELYNRFNIEFTKIIQAVESQQELITKVVYDSIVLDKRGNLIRTPWLKPIRGSYVKGNPPTDLTSMFDRGEVSDDYIPRKWFHLTRHAEFLKNDSYHEDTAAKLNEMLGNEVFSEYGAVLTEELSEFYDDETAADILNNKIMAAYGQLEDVKGEFWDSQYSEAAGLHSLGDLQDYLQDIYVDQGYSLEMASDLAWTEANYIFSQGETGVVSDLLDPCRDGTDYSLHHESQAVVRNTGVFFFDYEKALRTNSKISELVDIRKLQLYYRINVPYENFWMHWVDLRRKEVIVDVEDSEWSDLESSEQRVLVAMRQSFKSCADDWNTAVDSTDWVGVPTPAKYRIYYNGGLGSNPEAPTEATEDLYAAFTPFDQLISRNKYLQPAVNTLSGGDFEYSNLKYFIFDVPNPLSGMRLDGWNDMSLKASTGEGYTGLEAASVLDGYRLAAFRFTDFMSDDVAWHNTVNPDMPNVREQLLSSQNMNSRKEPNTCYGVTVKVMDTTHLAYQRFVNFILEEYEKIIPYTDDAQEICSYNNITNSYNSFFADAVEEKYPNKPWVRASYIAVTLSDLLFNNGGAPLTSTELDKRVLEQIIKIAPETGTLTETILFAEQFAGLVEYFAGVDGIDGGEYGPASSGDGSPHYTLKAMSGDGTDVVELYYYNERGITEEIFGDFLPRGAYDNEALTVRTPAPVPCPIGSQAFLNSINIILAGATADIAVTSVDYHIDFRAMTESTTTIINVLYANLYKYVYPGINIGAMMSAYSGYLHDGTPAAYTRGEGHWSETEAEDSGAYGAKVPAAVQMVQRLFVPTSPRDILFGMYGFSYASDGDFAAFNDMAVSKFMTDYPLRLGIEYVGSRYSIDLEGDMTRTDAWTGETEYGLTGMEDKFMKTISAGGWIRMIQDPANTRDISTTLSAGLIDDLTMSVEDFLLAFGADEETAAAGQTLATEGGRPDIQLVGNSYNIFQDLAHGMMAMSSMDMRINEGLNNEMALRGSEPDSATLPLQYRRQFRTLRGLKSLIDTYLLPAIRHLIDRDETRESDLDPIVRTALAGMRSAMTHESGLEAVDGHIPLTWTREDTRALCRYSYQMGEMIMQYMSTYIDHIIDYLDGGLDSGATHPVETNSYSGMDTAWDPVLDALKDLSNDQPDIYGLLELMSEADPIGQHQNIAVGDARQAGMAQNPAMRVVETGFSS